MRRHPVQEIIDHHLKRGETPPVFRDVGGKPSDPNGMSWWVQVRGVWSHVLLLGKRQFVDGRLL